MNFKHILFSLLFVSTAASSQSQNEKISRKTLNATKPVANKPATNTYKNDSLRLSLNYPSGWKVIDESNNAKNSLKVTFTDDVNNISLSNVPFVDSSEDYATGMEEDLATYNKLYSFVQN
jgi:hypothetical protein